MRILTPLILIPIGISIPLLFGSELLISSDHPNGQSAQSSQLLSSEKEAVKIIEMSKNSTSPSHRSTFAYKLARLYLELKTAGASLDLLEQTRSTARDLWITDLCYESATTLMAIGKHLISLKYPLDAITAYELALQKALSAPMKQDLKRILDQLKASSDK